MDQSQINAMSLFQDGEYEKAIEAMAKSSTVSPEEYKKFVAQCNQIIVEQYKYLINQALSERDYAKANSLRGEFFEKHGKNAAIEDLPIPSVSPQSSSPSISMPIQETSQKSKKVYYIIGGVIVLAVILVIWFISSSSEDSPSSTGYDYYSPSNEVVEEMVDTVAIEEVPEYEYNSYESQPSSQGQDSYQDDYSDFE